MKTPSELMVASSWRSAEHETAIAMGIDAQRLGLKTGDMVKLTSTTGSMVAKLKLWEGVRPGTVTKSFGQGHWAYGRVAAKEFGKAARGANNNELLVDDYDRLSGSTARNGGFTGVQIVKA